jgi:hypothetical protein
VIWECKSNHLYSHVLLIEHESTFVWNEDKLKRLWHVHHSQYDVYSNIGRWLLNNGTMLKTVCKSLHNGFEMVVVISEDKHQHISERPLWFDSNR